MTALVVAMLRARRAQALLVLLLSALAAAAAVAGPVYTAATDRAAVDSEIDRAARAEKTVQVSMTIDPTSASLFDSAVSSVSELPGFQTVYSVQLPVLGIEPEASNVVSSLVYRQDVCPHLTVVRGRCLMAGGEVVVGEATARRLGVQPGQAVPVTWAMYDEQALVWRPGGAPAAVTVVGVYRPVDTAEAYWGRSPFFLPGTDDWVREPVFASRPTVEVIDHRDDQRSAEAIAEPGSLRLDRLPGVVTAVDDLTDDVSNQAGTRNLISYENSLPDLLARIDRVRELTRQVVPVAALPLIGLCWLVVFLAVAYGAAARRHEQALVALRGGPRPTRWWLAAGESLVAVLVGAPVGYLLGSIVVGLVADARFDAGFTLAPAPGALLATGVAVAGAVLAGLLALRRDLAAPVVDLLRRVPPPAGAWRSLAIEVSAVVLAVVATVQLRLFDGALVGLGVLVPGLIALAVAVVAGRLLVPAAGRVGRDAVRRGRLGLALGALQVARRPGSHRLFVLLSVAVALVGFGVTAVDVADRARAARAEVETGAARTLEIANADAGTLLRAVRAVDPTGAYAMAVASTAVEGGPRLLYTDSRALGSVVAWRSEYGLPPADLAARLKPPTGEPVVLRGERLTLTVDLPRAVPPPTSMRMTVLLRPIGGGPVIDPTTGALSEGRAAYRLDAPACAAGCRVAAIQAKYVASGGSVATVRLVSLAAESGEVLVDPAGFAGAWRVSERAKATPDAQGLTVLVPGDGLDPRPSLALPEDNPQEMPVLAAGMPANLAEIANIDANEIPVRVVGTATALPRLGTGLLADLEYAERVAIGSTALTSAQVWLSPDAPADTADRLAAEGLVIVGRDSVEAAADRLDRRGPALAIWFHLLAAVGAVALAVTGMGLMAAVDRRRTLDDLVALRRQGLRRRTARRGALWAYLVVAATAVVTGAAAAALAWWLVGSYLPLYVDDAFALAPPTTPRPVAILVPALVVVVVFATVTVGLRRALRVRD